MCRSDTDVSTVVRFRLGNVQTRASFAARYLFTAVLLFAPLCFAQSGATWKHVAGTSISAGLAGEVSGPVTAIWYAPGTGALLAQTQSGRIFETQDFIHWRLNTLASRPATPGISNLSLPESGAAVQPAGARLYAAGRSNVFSSDDNGRTWVNLTGFNGQSILGDGFTSLASPSGNASEISVANRFGVWRSLDGGLSWTSLNTGLPNLGVRKLLGRRTALLANGSAIAASNGVWSFESATDPEMALRQRFGSSLQATVTAAAMQGTTAYAGAADGRLLVSHDGGLKWGLATHLPSTAVGRIWADAVRTDVALAAAGSRLYRTVNGGLFWDDVTGSLQAGQIHGLAADSSSSTIYIATDRGVYSAHISLTDAGATAPNWQAVARELPAAPAWDVRLNPDNTLTVALDGYGVFEAPSPNQTRNVRVVSGADLSERPAAPGSLISILGANVKSAKDPAANTQTNWPILAASDHSSQLQVPFEASSGTLSLSVEGSSQRWSLPLIVKEASPAIFVDEEGSPLIVDASSGLVVDPKIAVYSGSTVQILATGLGKVNPEWPTGVPAPLDAPPVVTGTVNAFLDGRQIEVLHATLAPSYIGYYLVELQIPSIVNRGAGELRLSMNGTESNPVKLYLEPNQPVQ
jgi:uncharacterized protein (TIGR03437 family)